MSEADQARATELYLAGNQEFTESHFAQALAKYKEALRHWDHPNIRYNIAICLINLDQLVEARDNLERSLAYGAAPLQADTYREGLTHRKLLDAQLARVKITCQDPGAEVVLDGKLLFIGPGASDQFLLPGDHQVIATRPGFLTASKTLVLVAGKLTAYDVPALELKPVTRIARRWVWWKPWAVLAAGGALGGLGPLAYHAAKADFSDYDAAVKLNCPDGCDADELARLGITAKRDSAEFKQAVAFSLYFAGGAAVIAGVIGVFLNQPRMQLESGGPLPIITPVPGGATTSLIWSY